ncbi:amino acid permease 2-like isoform X2 [Coffea eugenioides]|uniref:amino acid permease 2-like isoform X2 n=1 Tax=Coffea eugenioides TaxID=49369 RepID=UPI000F60BE0B|nr:amino acid permease 2-like isoform X2 [Coffea eugenioides]
MLTRSRTLPSRIYNGVVEERQDIRHYLQVEVQPKPQQEAEAINLQANYSKCFDDDGRLKRTGTLWTATSHIITAVIGSGVLSLAWAIGQLGWVAGPTVMLLFAFVILYTSNLLSQCYRSGNPVTGPRNYTYMDAVKATLGGRKVKICGLIQYINLFGVAIGYTIAASVSMMAIKRSNCFHESNGKDPCHMTSNGYMITFGIIEIIFSQIPDFDQVWWLSIVAAVMSFTYSTVGLSLGIAKVAENKSFRGSLTGISIGTITHAGTVTATQKLWRSLQALGAIAFAYSYSIILIEIQVYCQPFFAFVEKWSAQRWSNSDFVTAEYDIPIPFYGVYQLNFFRLSWRTAFVIVTSIIAMLMPFFNDVVGILGALGFWPLTVYFPIEIYVAQKKIGRWTTQWIGLQILSAACLLVSLSAAIGSVAGVVLELKTYKPFKTSY